MQSIKDERIKVECLKLKEELTNRLKDKEINIDTTKVSNKLIYLIKCYQYEM